MGVRAMAQTENLTAVGLGCGYAYIQKLPKKTWVSYFALTSIYGITAGIIARFSKSHPFSIYNFFSSPLNVFHVKQVWHAARKPLFKVSVLPRLRLKKSHNKNFCTKALFNKHWRPTKGDKNPHVKSCTKEGRNGWNMSWGFYMLRRAVSDFLTSHDTRFRWLRKTWGFHWQLYCLLTSQLKIVIIIIALHSGFKV